MLKFNRLFYKGGSDKDYDAFEDNIKPTPEQRKYLISCRNKIKNHLEPLIRKATKEELGMDREIKPRFRTQGSWSYNTCVIPAQNPPQEMDWDYGVYLPVTVWEENGPPLKMARAYFDLVERLLKDLCKSEKWEILSEKSTCIRLQVESWAHIDIPLYAAPEGEFEKVEESIVLEAALQRQAFDSMKSESVSFAESIEEAQQWEDIDCVVMATRDGEWRPSDPEAVSIWFNDRLEEYGEQLRRVCRYLKSWRDFHWQQGGPTSVSIMIAAAQAFEAFPNRDDLAVGKVARDLGDVFLNEIREPGIDNGEEDFNRLEESDRLTAASCFKQLADTLSNAFAFNESEKNLAIKELRREFGNRMPADVSLIDDGLVELIRSTPAERVAPPVVFSTTAG